MENDEEQKTTIEEIKIEELPPETASQAEKLMKLSRDYMESVVKELDLDPDEFYKGVGMGIQTILGVTTKFLQDLPEKKEGEWI